MRALPVLLLFSSAALLCSAANRVQEEVEEEERCVPSRCLNGGKCVEGGETGVFCECRFGFKGEFCEARLFSIYNLFQHDPEYMYDHPKDVWSSRVETEAIRPILASSTQTIADVLERLYDHMRMAQDKINRLKNGQVPQLFMAK